MATVFAYNAMGQGLELQSGTFFVPDSSGSEVTYWEETIIDSDTSRFYFEYDYNEFNAFTWIDSVYGSSYKITDVFYYDRYNNDLLDVYNFELYFDITDDFSNGTIFSNMFSGNDRVTGNSYADRLWLGAGSDVGVGRGGADKIFGEAGNDNLQGGDGFDTLDGGAGNDIVFGQAGNDVVKASTGSDRLIGGAGKDLLYGGTDTSRDVFDFNTRNDSTVGINRDIIYNFTRAADDIDLSSIDARVSTATNDVFLFKGISATAYSVWYSVSGSNVIVKGDVTGDKIADFEIFVVGVTSLSSGDFIL